VSAVGLLLYLASSLDRFSVLKYFFVLNLAYLHCHLFISKISKRKQNNSTFELFNCNLCNLGFLIGRDDVGVFYIFVSLLLDIH